MSFGNILNRLLACVFLLLLPLTGYGQSQLSIVFGSHEPAPKSVLTGQSKTLHWQPLSQPPFDSVLGIQHRFEDGQLYLQDDQPVQLTLRPGQWLRVSATQQNIAIWQDNGSGLWQRLDLEPVSQGSRLIYFIKGHPSRPGLIRLTTKEPGSEQRVMLAVSALKQTPRLYWEKNIPLPLASFNLPESNGDRVVYYQLKAGEVLSLPDQSGDYRLRLYPILGASDYETKQLSLRLKRSGQQDLHWYPEVDATRGQIPLGQSCVMPYGKPEVLNFHLSDDQVSGDKALSSLTSNQTVLLALTRLQRPLMNPDSNQLPSNQTMSVNKPWLSEWRVGELWQQARLRAVNNAYVDAPMYAALWLDQALKQQGMPRNDRDYLTAKLLQKHTRFQNLLPANSGIQWQTAWSDLKQTDLENPPANKASGQEDVEPVWLLKQKPEYNPSAGLIQSIYTPLNLSGQKGLVFKGRVPVTDLSQALSERLAPDSADPLREQLIQLGRYLKQNKDDLLYLSLPDLDGVGAKKHELSVLNQQSQIVDFLQQQGIAAERIEVLPEGQNEALPIPSQGEALGVDLWLAPKIRNEAGELVPALIYTLVNTPGSQAQQRLGHSLRLLVSQSDLADEQRASQGQIGLSWLGEKHVVSVEPAGQASDLSRAEQTLHSLAQHPAGAQMTYSPVFQHKRSSGPYISARWTDITLPADVKELRVWSERAEGESSGGQDVPSFQLALQQRVSQRFQLSWLQIHEQDELEHYAKFLYFIQSLGQTGQLPSLPEQLETSTQWLANHWLVLLHWLEEQRRHFKQGVYLPSSLDLAQIKPGSKSEIADFHNKAIRAGQDQRWLDALTYWNWLSYHADQPLRLQAETEKVAALQALGQHYQAKQQLKGLYLFGKGALKQQAYQQLRQLLLEQEQYQALIQLEVTQFLRFPSKESQRLLADLLWHKGSEQYAQQLMLSLPANDRDLALWQQISFANSQAIPNVQDDYDQGQTVAPGSNQITPFWLGMQAQARGDYASAEQFWSQSESLSSSQSQSGALAQRYRHYLQQGLLLRQVGLGSEARQHAWQQWWAKNPGPWQWQTASDKIVRSAGAVHLHIRSTGLGQTWHWLLPGQPLMLNSEGIGRIRIEARPLHIGGQLEQSDLISAFGKTVPNESTSDMREYDEGASNQRGFEKNNRDVKEVNSWLYLSQLDQVKAHPIRSMTTSSTLELDAELSHLRLGVKNTLEYQPEQPGEVIWLRSRQPLLVRVFRPVPKYPLALLPEPSSQALMLSEKQVQSSVDMVGIETVQSCTSENTLSALVEQQLRDTDITRQKDNLVKNFSPKQLAATAMDYPYLEKDYREAREVSEALTTLHQTDQILVKQRPSESYEQMLSLLWQAEHRPEQLNYVLSQVRYLEQITDAKRINPVKQSTSVASAGHAGKNTSTEYRIQSLANRLNSMWRWQDVSAIRAGAGQQKVKQDSLVSGGYTKRIQQALMPSPRSDEQLFSGQQELHYQIASTGEMYELKLELLPVRFVKAQPVFVDVLLEGKPVNRVRLNHIRNSLAIRLSLPEGQHGLSLKLSDNWANQWVSSQLLKIDDGQRVPVFNLKELEQRYFVASQDQPVLLKVQGPTLLRIDQVQVANNDQISLEADNNSDHPQADHFPSAATVALARIESHYRFVGSGLHQLALRPDQGQPRGLFRVYQQVVKTDIQAANTESKERARIYRPPVVVQSMAKDLGLAGQSEITQSNSGVEQGWPQVGELIDNAPTISVLAGYQWQAEDDEQPDGQSFSLAVQRRMYAKGQPYQFYELRLSPDDRSEDSVLQLKGLWRYSKDNDALAELPFFGRNDLPGSPDHISAQARVAVQGEYASVYGQLAARWNLSQEAGAYYRRGDISHWFELAAFYYALPPEYTVTRQLSDQIWSEYREDHSFGVRLSDQVNYPLTMDTALTLRSDLVTNTDLTPDYLDLQLSAWHQAGLWQWGVSYLPEYRFDDQDRDEAYWKQRLQLDFNRDYRGSSYRGRSASRWQLRGELGVDIDEGQPYGALYLIRHQSDGDLFDDFPNQRFRDLRMQHFPLEVPGSTAPQAPLSQENLLFQGHSRD